MTTPTLPPWAKLAEHQQPGRLPRIDVDASAMYEAWLAAFAAGPPVLGTADNPGRDAATFGARRIRIVNAAAKPGDPTEAELPAMTAADACDPASPTQYWLECAYQCMKLELQAAMRTFGFDIRVHDADKRFALAAHPPGRGIVAATWGKEAREHFRRLRGFVPG